jgi:outer membrane protein assembly factor BamE (lipoprotein component of BamABCDE complex)
MTRDQVRFLLGLARWSACFTGDRWDYVYLLKRGKGTERCSRAG